ncbi:MAG TPA: hypothetical protein VHF89_18115 [Solirubrobacteraceae bacterium]|nr:hypothetical protein [Solirubrobacteraceae bacterium]
MHRLAGVTVAILLAACPAAAAKPGDLDRAFGNGGVASTALLDGGWHGLVQRDGRIVIAGGVQDPGLWRLMPGGRRDVRFGRGGVADAGRGGLPFDLRRVRGELRVGLRTVTVNEPPIALLRFEARGRRLQTAVHEPFFPGPLSDGFLRPDGGAYVNSFSSGVRAVRPDGSLDTAFSGGTLENGDLPGWRDVQVAAVRRDGRILARARRAGEPHLLLLTPDGQLDPAFGGGDGAAEVPFPPAVVRFLRGGDIAAASSRGRFIVRVFRLSRSGARRGSFGRRGVAGTWTIGRRYEDVRDLVEDARGRLYALAVNRVFALSRSGRRLRGFGRRGVSRRPRAARRSTYVASDLAVHRRRGLIVVGTEYVGNPAHPGLGGCYDIREDFCAEDVGAVAWRVRR